MEEFEFVRDLEHDLADLQAHLREEQGVPLPEGVPGPDEIESPDPELVTRLAPVVQEKPAMENCEIGRLPHDIDRETRNRSADDSPHSGHRSQETSRGEGGEIEISVARPPSQRTSRR